jgi:hypothetical protein
MRKKLLRTLPVLALAFVLGGALRAFASVGDTGVGWLWGGGATINSGGYEGMGAISFNSLDTARLFGNAVEYGVNIPPAGCSGGACKVTGYAWSGGTSTSVGEFYNWIDFNPQDHCGSAYAAASCALPVDEKGVPQKNWDGTSNPGVYRQGDKLVGWARLVGVAVDSAKGNSGGWDGWIFLKDVTVRPDGTLNGYGWNGEKLSPSGVVEGLGWIDFRYAKVATPPDITFKAIPDMVAPGGYSTLEWEVKAADTCSASSSPASRWSGSKSETGGREKTDPITVATVYTLECEGPGGKASKKVTVGVKCVPDRSCDAFDVSRECSNKSCFDGCEVKQGEVECGRGWREVAP